MPQFVKNYVLSTPVKTLENVHLPHLYIYIYIYISVHLSQME